jgi:hypothetical protein
MAFRSDGTCFEETRLAGVGDLVGNCDRRDIPADDSGDDQRYLVNGYSARV